MKGRALAFLGGVGLGALIMYFLDPDAGGRRRSVARDKVVKSGRRTGEAIQGRAKDLAHRAKGLTARTRSKLEGDDNPTDDVLAQRVRTALGRVISHPRMINISAQAGVVTLNGSVSEEEAKGLTEAVRKVQGVKDVVDRTEVREEVMR